MGPFDGLTAVQRQQIREARGQRKITDADLASRTDRGICPEPGCGREFQLKKDGTLRVHGSQQGWPPSNCNGSGQRPKEAGQ